MSSKLLERAREYEKEHIRKIHPSERPCYHVTGGVGWINDPNGFSWYKGEYHMFHQYHPYSNQWGPMHWGHLVSRDMIRWEYRPAVMAPDQEYDQAGVFSGSAITLEDGRQLLLYTGVSGDMASGKIFQTQCVAVGDGENYKKYEGNPVIRAEDVPEGGSLVDFRDPKIWRDGDDGMYYAVASDAAADNSSSSILLYKSPDGFCWEYVGVIDTSTEELGGMWECPDFFPLDGKQILLVSPMAMQPKGLAFHVGHCSICIPGTYDKKTYQFTREGGQLIDYGIDFYAPQTMLAPDGRRIMAAWMQAWTNSKFVPKGVKYFGQLTIPRELCFKDGRLIQNPVREIENYRSEAVRYENVELTPEWLTLDGICGRVLDMTVTIRPETERGEVFMKLADNGKYYTDINYRFHRGVLHVERSHCGYLYDVVHSRRIQVEALDGELKLRILMDRYSIEIFINDGRQAASFTIYTPQEANGIRFSADGKAKISIEKYDLLF